LKALVEYYNSSNKIIGLLQLFWALWVEKCEKRAKMEKTAKWCHFDAKNGATGKK